MKEFDGAWTNYFDDFVIVGKADELASVNGSIKFVFKALGWLFAEDGDKAPDFSHSVSALGVQINVQDMHAGTVTIDNTSGRKSDLTQLLSRIRGKLQFASGQFAGRIARKSLHVVTKHAYSICGSELDDDIVKSLKLHNVVYFIEYTQDTPAMSLMHFRASGQCWSAAMARCSNTFRRRFMLNSSR